ICNRTTPDLMAAHAQKRRLKDEPGGDREKVEAAESKILGAKSQQRPNDRDEKTRGGNDQ
ncbi:MAG: hypothetical protein ACXWBM_10875, partial [Chthoniobacterales bacterium]